MRKLRLTDIISMILVVTLLVGVISFSMLAQLDDFVARAEADASVTLASVEEGPFYFGDTVQLFVTVTGMNGSYRLEWQYNDGEHGWQPLGFSGSTYTYVVDESNVDLLYRVVAYTADEPVAEEPAAEEPAAEDPVAEEPAADEPVVEESPAEEPVAEELPAEEPVAEEPVAEEPAAEEPVVEESPAEEPAAEEPVAEELPAEAPVTEEPAEEAPAEDAPAEDETAAE